MRESLEKFRKSNPGHQIDVCGALIRNTKTSGSSLSVDARDSLSDIRKKAREYGWHIFENQMDHSDGYPKWTKDPYATSTGNAEHEWAKVAAEILAKISLREK